MNTNVKHITVLCLHFEPLLLRRGASSSTYCSGLLQCLYNTAASGGTFGPQNVECVQYHHPGSASKLHISIKSQTKYFQHSCLASPPGPYLFLFPVHASRNPPPSPSPSFHGIRTIHYRLKTHTSDRHDTVQNARLMKQPFVCPLVRLTFGTVVHLFSGGAYSGLQRRSESRKGQVATPCRGPIESLGESCVSDQIQPFFC